MDVRCAATYLLGACRDTDDVDRYFRIYLETIPKSRATAAAASIGHGNYIPAVQQLLRR